MSTFLGFLNCCLEEYDNFLYSFSYAYFVTGFCHFTALFLVVIWSYLWIYEFLKWLKAETWGMSSIFLNDIGFITPNTYWNVNTVWLYVFLFEILLDLKHEQKEVFFWVMTLNKKKHLVISVRPFTKIQIFSQYHPLKLMLLLASWDSVFFLFKESV